MNVKGSLRIFRVLSSMTQVQAGKATGIKPSRISLIENGLVEPRPDEKERLAKALGVTPEAIWRGSTQEQG